MPFSLHPEDRLTFEGDGVLHASLDFRFWISEESNWRESSATFVAEQLNCQTLWEFH